MGLWGHIVPLDMKGCICHFWKWQIHPFISKETNYSLKNYHVNHCKWPMSLRRSMSIITRIRRGINIHPHLGLIILTVIIITTHLQYPVYDQLSTVLYIYTDLTSGLRLSALPEEVSVGVLPTDPFFEVLKVVIRSLKTGFMLCPYSDWYMFEIHFEIIIFKCYTKFQYCLSHTKCRSNLVLFDLCFPIKMLSAMFN